MADKIFFFYRREGMTKQAIKHCSSNHPEERVTLIRPNMNGDCGVGAVG